MNNLLKLLAVLLVTYLMFKGSQHHLKMTANGIKNLFDKVIPKAKEVITPKEEYQNNCPDCKESGYIGVCPLDFD